MVPGGFWTDYSEELRSVVLDGILFVENYSFLFISNFAIFNLILLIVSNGNFFAFNA